MYKNIILIGVLLFLSNCNQHSNVSQHNLNSSSFTYQEKPFEIKWKIEKKFNYKYTYRSSKKS